MKYKNLLSYGITDFGRKKQYKKTSKNGIHKQEKGVFAINSLKIKLL